MSYVLHLPAKNKDIYKSLLEENYIKTIHKPDNVDIVIPITLDQIDNSYIIKQLHNSGYNYYNCIDKEIKWEKADKLIYVYNSLKLCENEYVLVLDGNDTVFLKDLDNIVEDFKTYDAKVVYNAEIYKYKRLVKCCYNGGVCFGRKEDLLEFYARAIDFYNKSARKYPSEQPYLLKAISGHNEIRFDRERTLFLCYNYQWEKGEC